MTKRRILFLINESDYFCQHWLPLIEQVRQPSDEIHVAANLSSQHAQNILSQHHMIFHSLQLQRRSMGLLTLFTEWLRMIRILCSVRPQLLFAITWKPLILGGLASMLISTKRHFNLPGMGYLFIQPQPIYVTLARQLVTLALRLIARFNNTSFSVLNADDKAELSQLIQQRASVTILPGVGYLPDKHPLLPLPQPPLVVALVARLIRDKGVMEFIEAAQQLKQKQCPVRMVLVGGIDRGNRHAIDASLLQQLHTDHVIEWWGYQRDMSTVWPNVHIAILPSYREGLGMSLIEAAASGRPVIASDVSGCRATLIDGKTGRLIQPRSAQAIVEAVEWMVKQPLASLTQMGIEGRKHVEQQFSMPAVVKIMRQLLA